MVGEDSSVPFQRIQELERENEALREQLRKKQSELEEADAEIERLRQELKNAQRASRHSDSNAYFNLKGQRRPDYAGGPFSPAPRR
jgi:predicted nuclease with TOPRIM domain